MRKFLFILMSLFMIQASANVLEPSALNDNVSVTVKGGVTTPLNDPVNHFRGMFGIELEKMITPIFGVGIEGEWTIDTSTWPNRFETKTAIDHQYVGVYTVTNWMNLIGGYKGTPRKFEIESVLGSGWGHSYGYVENYVLVKHGLNVNYNVREDLSFSLKPAVIYNLSNPTQYDIRRAALQLQVGVTYRFVGKSGNRHFTFSDKIYSRAYVDELNAKVNRARENCEAEKRALQDQINKLTTINEDLAKAVREKKEVVVTAPVEFLPIQFTKGSAVIPSTSAPILDNITKNLTDASYTIIGYASEEGSQEFNQKLSEARAKAVYEDLVKRGVDASKFTVVGKGVTKQFGNDLESNRVVIVKN